MDDDQLAYVRSHVGDVPSDEDLHDAYERLGTTGAVVVEVLRRRLADLLNAPATFAVPGEYSQSTGENIRALQAQLADYEAGLLGGGAVRVVAPPAPRPR